MEFHFKFESVCAINLKTNIKAVFFYSELKFFKRLKFFLYQSRPFFRKWFFLKSKVFFYSWYFTEKITFLFRNRGCPVPVLKRITIITLKDAGRFRTLRDGERTVTKQKIYSYCNSVPLPWPSRLHHQTLSDNVWETGVNLKIIEIWAAGVFFSPESHY